MNVQAVVQDLQNTLRRATAAGAWIEGRCEPFTQEDIDVAGREIALGPTLAEFYRTAGPRNLIVPASVEDLVLYDLHELVQRQEGYRWCAASPEQLRRFPTAARIRRTSGAISDWIVNPDWDPSWVVIGDMSADPIIADTDDARTPIYFARHGTGRWKLEPAAPSPAAMLAALVVWVEIALLAYNGRFRTDDAEMQSEVVLALRAGWAKVLPPNCVATLENYFS